MVEEKEFNPDISVIMSVHNAEKYVGDAIASVLNQTFRNFELILINDGSTDSSNEIILNIKDSRIRFYCQENQGQTKTSNKGVELSKGKYIKFFDADDILHPEHLEKQFKALSGSEDKLASCQWVYFYQNHKNLTFPLETTNKNYMNPMDWFYDSHEYDQGMMGAWMWLIPRTLLDKSGYWNESLTLNNDFDFSVRLLCASKGVVFAKGSKIYYRKGVSNALSGTTSRSAMESAISTTEMAMRTILSLENSDRMNRLLANRFQSWVYVMYPKHPDLIKKAEEHITSLGGSDLRPAGGSLFHMLNKIMGWKRTYKIQYLAYKFGWKVVLKLKSKKKKVSATRTEN
ncbi:glycosyltransferase family 2 protein [Mangrovimonas sp. CR14]|uniref:glycosyltransferase family 2 protein n=1 Tax=Mangrovimonas sp. CR14 TaxID=2706120 RepID=UPI001423BF6E|nr:glycosyltransferase family 2 protein [Mangrovimonas sp. CR14]NIK91360.1 glycosyltransferase family 2 protein [Mangrovimonas sp. CR14]